MQRAPQFATLGQAPGARQVTGESSSRRPSKAPPTPLICLNEHQVGFHPSHIGFPNLGDCMAVALQTRTGLYGFHFTPGNAAQASAFRDFIEHQMNQSGSDTPVHLYGSCRRGRRWAGDANNTQRWQEEMKAIADAIGFRGPISGLDLSKASHAPSDAEGTGAVYLEYVRNPVTNSCEIRYKNMAKMALTPAPQGTTGTDLNIARVTPIGPWGAGGYRLSDPKMSLTSDARLDTNNTRSSSGKMHSPSRSDLDSFTH
ncbi:hypothetical protein [Pandoraea anhela]|nr:hypothetical protein [Pandoraea anhela]